MNGYDNGINWSQMIDNLDYHLSLITNGEVMRYIDLWTSVDLGIENMGRTLERILEYVMNMGAGETISRYSRFSNAFCLACLNVLAFDLFLDINKE